MLARQNCKLSQYSLEVGKERHTRGGFDVMHSPKN